MPATGGRYLHWDKLRRLPHPPGLSSRQWWLKIKLARANERRELPLADIDGQPFGFTLPDDVLRHLHLVDQRCSGEIGMEKVVTSEKEARRRFLVNSLMEEAIRSSQLEGATTSRLIAKEMLRSGRRPKDHGERMIANNYRALQFVRDDLSEDLTPEAVLELHRIVTEGTLKNPDAAGRLQRPDEERVAVFDRDDQEHPVHRPPPAEELPERMEMLCRFANEPDEGEQFVHPVVRAILLHFWLAYDHPFEDGNGRTARILFFWAMRKHNYWLAEYLPISRFIRKARAQYERAFLETETDEGDTTYFLIHQLRVIEQAIDDLDRYLQQKIAEQNEMKARLRALDTLNGRQLVLLTHAAKNPDHTYTFAGHARSNRVTHETARSDLGDLADRGFLVRRRRGRTYVFEVPDDLPERLRESRK
ncbi:MAG TPA: Fic family protein [Solirubrobacterales bacterium]|nr:Fic family protein [Solirubrobacterales bacterium]